MTRPRSRATATTKVRFFCARALADGSVMYSWKPSTKYRRLGWAYQELGRDHAAAIGMAITRNAELLAWEQNRTAAQPAIHAAPRRWTFGMLLDHYLASKHFTQELAPKTRANYRTSIEWLRAWANDGDLPVAQLTGELVDDLRETLVDGPMSAHVVAMRLRVLRLLLAYGVRPLRIIAVNPARELDIDEPAPRRKRVLLETVEALAAAALDLGRPQVAMAVTLGFWSMQRRGDLLAASRRSWRRMLDVAPVHRAVIAGPDGHAWGLRLRQQKTKAWVDAVVPGHVVTLVESHLEQMAIASGQAGGPGGATVADLADPLIAGIDGKLVEEWEFQRAFRFVVDTLHVRATKDGDEWLAEQLADADGQLQFRDLRRSGMCWWRDHGATIPMIASQSGHSIGYTQRILDTYMPGDSRAAGAGLATTMLNSGTETRARSER